IWDGTYVYIHKSSNNVFQRSCYSMHKQLPLIKPMACVALNEYIIDELSMGILKLASRILIVQSIPHLMIDFRNATAFHNMFYSVIISDAQHSEEIAQLMLDRLHKPNSINVMVKELKPFQNIIALAKMAVGWVLCARNDSYMVSGICPTL
ncbi:hypothetical protein ALC57_08180, partial [Trachymyrmex cornetzi]